jgi:hypothetical protein
VYPLVNHRGTVFVRRAGGFCAAQYGARQESSGARGGGHGGVEVPAADYCGLYGPRPGEFIVVVRDVHIVGGCLGAHMRVAAAIV